MISMTEFCPIYEGSHNSKLFAFSWSCTQSEDFQELLLPDTNENIDKPDPLRKTAAELSDKSRNAAYNLDYVARILFPVTFFIFVFVYWCVYLVRQTE